jgi:hypothetical protein
MAYGIKDGTEFTKGEALFFSFLVLLLAASVLGLVVMMLGCLGYAVDLFNGTLGGINMPFTEKWIYVGFWMAFPAQFLGELLSRLMLCKYEDKTNQTE